ncbi:MAG TPA: hypothetical protein PKD26_05870 [Pyrinomonadaceae bacterium]|nr:hypothetical protein [Pyrinomonadaceae bacterium]
MIYFANSPGNLRPARHVSLFLSVLLLATIICTTIRPAASQTNQHLEAVITAAARERSNYIDRFRDLISEEIRSFQVFDRQGRIRRSRTVISTFVVFQYGDRSDSIAEFRNIVSIDGRMAGKTEERAASFFTHLTNIRSAERTLERIEKEGSRSDLDYSINGLTLFQSVALAENLRPYFDFSMQEINVEGQRPLLAVSYRQKGDCPFILFGRDKVGVGSELKLVFDLGDEALRKLSPRLNGVLWIDKETLRVVKEERRLNAANPKASGSRLISETIFEYVESDLGLNVPSTIFHTQFRPKSPGIKETTITFRYSSFSRPEVEIRGTEIRN